MWEPRDRDRDLPPSLHVPVTPLIQAAITSSLLSLAPHSCSCSQTTLFRISSRGDLALAKMPPVASSCSRSVTFTLLLPWPLPVPSRLLLSPCSLTSGHVGLSESLATQCHSRAFAPAVPSAFDAFPLIFMILPPQSSVQMSPPQKAQ